ncbi:MAG TPA: GNAT family N-acetyltransferase [Myxococcota bacterium]|nr:GNAT family N-acetyltransferase [Myxococcota bacterium]
MQRPELETERLRLRQFRESDLAAYARITGDAETMRFLARGAPFERDAAWRSLGYILGHWRIRGHGLWAVEEKASGALVGRIGLVRPDGWPGLEVAWLVARERWGEGFATEGARAALDHAFSILGARRAISLIAPENSASIRVAEKLGMRFDELRQISGRTAALFAIEAQNLYRGSDRSAGE